MERAADGHARLLGGVYAPTFSIKQVGHLQLCDRVNTLICIERVADGQA